MTDFIYENQEQVTKLSTMLCKEGDIQVESGPWNISVYKYLISYWISGGEKITPQMLEKLKSELAFDLYNFKTRIFFEKVQSQNRDYLYFIDYMNEIEKDPGFFSTWQTWFAKIA